MHACSVHVQACVYLEVGHLDLTLRQTRTRLLEQVVRPVEKQVSK